MDDECPVCHHNLPEANWVWIVTQRQTDWCPEEGFNVCYECWEREMERRAEDRFEELGGLAQLEAGVRLRI